jgi:putative flippase GtrA
MSSQFLRFLATGGVAAIVNLASRYALNEMMSFEAAVVVAYLVGMTTAYALARLFVFEKSGRSVASEFKRFIAINLFALLLVWCVSVGLALYAFPAIGFAWHPDDVAHFVGVTSPAIVSYFGHRHYTFRPAGILAPTRARGGNPVG